MHRNVHWTVHTMHRTIHYGSKVQDNGFWGPWSWLVIPKTKHTMIHEMVLHFMAIVLSKLFVVLYGPSSVVLALLVGCKTSRYSAKLPTNSSLQDGSRVPLHMMWWLGLPQPVCGFGNQSSAPVAFSSAPVASSSVLLLPLPLPLPVPFQKRCHK